MKIHKSEIENGKPVILCNWRIKPVDGNHTEDYEKVTCENCLNIMDRQEWKG